MAGKGGSKPGPRVEPILSSILPAGAIPMPSKPNNRGSKTAYPFDQLTAVGMSFGVLNKTPEQLASIVSNMNRKPGPAKLDPATGAQLFEMVDMLGADGKPTGTKVPNTEKPLHHPGPQFFVVAPAEDDPANKDENGKKLPADKRIKARVFRSA